MVVAVMAWQLGLNLPSIQSVHMTNKSLNYNPEGVLNIILYDNVRL
jgi:hypothetical protein